MTRNRSLSLAVVALVVLGLLALAPPAHAINTYTVNVTADDDDGMCQGLGMGDCTLREAIVAANASAGLDKIVFALGSGVPTINITGVQLPAITDRIQINGNTGGASRVELTGPPGVDVQIGLFLQGSGSQFSIIRKLVVNGFGGGGITIQDSASNTITGNWLGTDETGLAAGEAGSQAGLRLQGSSSNTIGGTTAGLRNVLSGNGFGLVIAGGGMNTIQGNYIGLDRNGVGPIPNSLDGIQTTFTVNNQIGGPTDAHGNVIGANGDDGIQLFNTSTGHFLSSNIIGMNVNLEPAPNGNAGVSVTDTSTGNKFGDNRINHNSGLGIDLDPGGPTPNDQLDADTGPNELQNFPIVTGARFIDSNGHTVINGRIRSTPNSTIEIWAFWNPQPCDGFGDPEAQNPIAVTVSNTDAQGRGQWTIDIALDPPPPPGSAITTTATSPAGSTSEISPCVPMQP